ncbi:hypothetical protein [Halocynthiibacter styelae]|uniref:Tat pathway signal sequence domain protein n=1 Tax=Halocynthiibacter styelae TaxID=2761955 RepID=A0A8J7IPF0_9RHOB|nr:hypothetical protein [Paenihalocynthiibacter styelae]MBI1494656.1 hypothetical protein [Paenihalocynthiibacter styelae]
MKTHDRKFPQLAGALITAGLAIMGGPVRAETSAPEPQVSIELNTLTNVEGGCRLSFLAQNTLETDLDRLVLETVLFTKEGAVQTLTLFDFQALPTGRPRVRQFDLAGASCESLGNILINGVNQCVGGDLDANACADALKLQSRTENEVLG